MKDQLINFKEQFKWIPEIQNSEKLSGHKNVILIGMGGSHLAAGFLKMIQKGIDIYVHRSYGLPPYDGEFLRDSLILLVSYSGNTEETLDAYDMALEKGLNVAVISSGGKLLEQAKRDQIPFVTLPQGIVPRMTIGYISKAIAYVKRDGDLIKKLESIDIGTEIEDVSKEIVQKIQGTPLIYVSNDNLNIAYIWKIAMNENAKIPAWYNVLPECNHNEIQGMVGNKDKCTAIFIISPEEDKRIVKRFNAMEELYKKYDIEVLKLEKNISYTNWCVYMILLGLWTSYELALMSGVDPEGTPQIEEFKKKLI